jgi:hypothetical protein
MIALNCRNGTLDLTSITFGIVTNFADVNETMCMKIDDDLIKTNCNVNNGVYNLMMSQ